MKLRVPALAGVILAATLPLSATAPAHAASKCPRDYICGWPKPHMHGKKDQWFDQMSPGCYRPNTSRSVSNQGRSHVTFYNHAGCHGSHFTLKSHTHSNKTPWKVRAFRLPR
ncbi:peptidase inhibitor family I36 protein [Streptomyces sp. NPDC058773]|uniref:peptidase inhibitor family I36 protein n=1 Tax=Streptomyces sp. NPDC058773 TaxID=3346632 RepID=UPI0036942D52